MLSGGGNDFTNKALEMLLNHKESGFPTLNKDIIKAAFDVRLRAAYLELISLATESCNQLFNPKRPIPVLVHGYAYAVPDGREVGGHRKDWSFVPGPWLKPAFHSKGYFDLPENTKTIKRIINRFNRMLSSLPKEKGCSHVRYVDLRPLLSNDLKKYKKDWGNEIHPKNKAFKRIAKKFKKIIENQ